MAVDETFDLRDLCEAELKPLVKRVTEFCKKHKIPMFMTFCTANNGDFSCVTSAFGGRNGWVPPAYHEIAEILQDASVGQEKRPNFYVSVGLNHADKKVLLLDCGGDEAELTSRLPALIAKHGDMSVKVLNLAGSDPKETAAAILWWLSDEGFTAVEAKEIASGLMAEIVKTLQKMKKHRR